MCLALTGSRADREIYADLFETGFFIHPALTGLGIVIVKIASPESVFRGILEFWPLDIQWDGATASVRRIPVGLPPMQNHVAFRVDLAKEEIFERLTLRGIAARYEPRGPGLVIVGFDDPDGNFVELFPNIETIELPPQAFCDAQELDRVMAECRALLDRWASVDERGQPIYPLGVGIFRKSFRKGFVVTVAPVSPPAKGLSDRPETVATITNLVAKSFDEVLGGFGVALTHVKAVGVGSPSVAM